jgi:hypothetical protein
LLTETDEEERKESACGQAAALLQYRGELHQPHLRHVFQLFATGRTVSPQTGWKRQPVSSADGETFAVTPPSLSLRANINNHYSKTQLHQSKKEKSNDAKLFITIVTFTEFIL